MAIRSISVPESPVPSGRYSQAVCANGLLFLAGVGPYDPVTRAVVGDTVGEQTSQVMHNVKAVLQAVGGDVSDIVNCTAYLAELQRDWTEFDSTYGSFFQPPFPARTTVGAVLKGILVELSVVAVCRS